MENLSPLECFCTSQPFLLLHSWCNILLQHSMEQLHVEAYFSKKQVQFQGRRHNQRWIFFHPNLPNNHYWSNRVAQHFPPMIEQTKICSMLEIPKNYECNLKVKNLGFGHKTNAHANCKRNVTSNMGYMKEFPNYTTIVCSINKRNQHVGSKQQARLYWNQIGDVIIKTEIEQTFKIVPLMREKHTKDGVENFYTQILCK